MKLYDQKRAKLSERWELALHDEEEQWKVTPMKQCFKKVNNCLNTNIYSYLEKSGGQSIH
jgi:hypothetical protein